MQNMVIPVQGKRVLFLGGDNVSARVLSAILKSDKAAGATSPVVFSKVLRPVVTKEQRANSTSSHLALDGTIRDFNLAESFVSDTKKFKLHDVAATLGMVSPLPPQIQPNATAEEAAAAAAASCPFTVDQIRGEFLNQFDVTVVASFKYYIPDSIVRALSPVVNMHPSLVPKYRGASPLYYPVLKGEVETGASIIRISPSEGMDSGDILKQSRVVIREGEDGRTLYPRVLDMGSNLMRQVLEDFKAHWDGAVEQERKLVKFTDDEYHAAKLTKEHSRVVLEKWSGDDVTNAWRAFVGSNYMVPFCDFSRTATPVCSQLRSEDKKKPQRVNFTEIVPNCNVPQDARDELKHFCESDPSMRQVFKFAEKEKLDAAAKKSADNSSISVGSVYTPLCNPALAAVKSNKGWFWVKRVTLFNGKSQEWKLLSTSLNMKPGVLYEHCFITCPPQPAAVQ